MKNLLKPTFALSMFIFSLAACTAGDKGSDRVPDSVSIDTTMSATSSAGNGTKSESFDSSAIDTASTPGSISKDTTQKDRSANGAADFKPNK